MPETDLVNHRGAIPTPKICHHKPWTLIQRCVHRCSETAKRLGASPRPSNAMTLAMTATTVEEAHLLVDIIAKIAIGCSGFGKPQTPNPKPQTKNAI